MASYVLVGCTAAAAAVLVPLYARTLLRADRREAEAHRGRLEQQRQDADQRAVLTRRTRLECVRIRLENRRLRLECDRLRAAHERGWD